MSDKSSKKNITENKKKASKNGKIPTLRLDNGVETPAKTAYIKNTKHFKINDIDIDKIRVSDKKLYNKSHNSYKYYMFYEHSDEYIPLRIVLKDVVGYYNDCKDNSKYDTKYSAKRISLRVSDDDDSLDKAYDILIDIEERLGIDLNNFMYESRGEEYLKTIVSDETCFRKSKDNKTNIIPNENTNYICGVLLQIQSVYYSMKDNGDIRYYPQVLIEQCGYKTFSNNVLFHPDLEFTDTEPDSQPNDSDVSEEEINENTVFDE